MDTFYLLLVRISRQMPPLVWISASFLCGLAVGFGQPCLMPFVCVWACAEWWLLRHTLTRAVIYSVLISAFLAGLSRTLYEQVHYYRHCSQLPRGKVTVQGIVEAIEPVRGKTHKRILKLLVVDISSTAQPQQQQSTSIWRNTRALISIEHPDEITIGALLSLNDTVFFPQPSLQQMIWFAREGAQLSGRTTRTTTVTTLARKTSWRTLLLTMRKNLLARAEKEFSPHTYTLFSALFLGYTIPTSQKTGDYRERFSWWGISHLLARSGLHLILIASCISFILGLFPFSARKKSFCSVIVIILYSIFSWPSVSFMRALIMFLWHHLCIAVYLASHAVHTIAGTALLICLWQPCYALCLDFQLSFALTLALAIARSTQLLDSRK